ncbi:MAG TPA: hypothetical protein VKV24_14140 [Casimicrobiaceae bacterium]|nr:hypothetical protein [Casimicrobiaceae bacterium]
MQAWLGALGDALRIRRTRPRYVIPASLAGWFRIVEIDEVEAYAGALFRRAFRCDPPLEPRHFVARVAIGNAERTIGYVHYAKFDDIYLCGGMCMDERMFRRLPAERRTALKAAGGVAEQMLRHTFDELSHAKAVFGYVGDRRAERVDLRAGFRHTGRKHLIVFWPGRLSRSEREAITDRVAALGPF